MAVSQYNYSVFKKSEPPRELVRYLTSIRGALFTQAYIEQQEQIISGLSIASHVNSPGSNQCQLGQQKVTILPNYFSVKSRGAEPPDGGLNDQLGLMRQRWFLPNSELKLNRDFLCQKDR